MITLSSDFGSPYPAAMRGVILQATDARVVDVTHDFPRQDVRAAAFWLREVLPYFPPSVHCVVVDPGVGTDRAAIAVRAGGHGLVGPDNGVLLPAARRLASGDDTGDGANDVDVFRYDYDDPDSVTFHGRDVFAPMAALVHEAGIERFHERGDFDETGTYEAVRFPESTVGDGTAAGEVLVADGFGNAITNVPGSVLDGQYGGSIRVNGRHAPVEPTYAAVGRGDRLVTVGSHGNVELAVNQGRGTDAFDVAPGRTVEFDWTG